MTLAHTFARALPALCAGFAATLAQAATLQIAVLDKEGAPVQDAAVLVRYTVAPATQPQIPRTAVIEQEKLRFKPFLSIVPPGTMLSFVNRDSFDHHIRASAPPAAKEFELRIGPAGSKPGEVKVDGVGRYALGCHLHSQMRGYVLVADTPWFGKTNDKGELTLNDLPEGVVDVVVVHPEQFLDQPPQRATLGKAPAELQSRLNFTPRRRKT
jgi:plastocyanin